MKRLCLIILALLLNSDTYLTKRYYVAVIFVNNQVYEEYMTYKDILHVVGSFVDDKSIQSLHIFKDV